MLETRNEWQNYESMHIFVHVIHQIDKANRKLALATTEPISFIKSLRNLVELISQLGNPTVFFAFQSNLLYILYFLLSCVFRGILKAINLCNYVCNNHSILDLYPQPCHTIRPVCCQITTLGKVTRKIQLLQVYVCITRKRKLFDRIIKRTLDSDFEDKNTKEEYTKEVYAQTRSNCKNFTSFQEITFSLNKICTGYTRNMLYKTLKSFEYFYCTFSEKSCCFTEYTPSALYYNVLQDTKTVSKYKLSL